MTPDSRLTPLGESFLQKKMTRREFLILCRDFLLGTVAVAFPTVAAALIERIRVNEWQSYDLTDAEYEELISDLAARGIVPRFGIIPLGSVLEDVKDPWEIPNQIREETGSEETVSFFSVFQDIDHPDRMEQIRRNIETIDARGAQVQINLGLAPYDRDVNPLLPQYDFQTENLITRYLFFLQTIHTKKPIQRRILFEFNIGPGTDIAYGNGNYGFSGAEHKEQFLSIYRLVALKKMELGLTSIELLWCVSAKNTNFDEYFPGFFAVDPVTGREYRVVDGIAVDIYDEFVGRGNFWDLGYWFGGRTDLRAQLNAVTEKVEKICAQNPTPIRKIVSEYGSKTRDPGALLQILAAAFDGGWDIAMYFNLDKRNHYSASPVFSFFGMSFYNVTEVDWSATPEVIQVLKKLRSDVLTRMRQ